MLRVCQKGLLMNYLHIVKFNQDEILSRLKKDSAYTIYSHLTGGLCLGLSVFWLKSFYQDVKFNPQSRNDLIRKNLSMPMAMQNIMQKFWGKTLNQQEVFNKALEMVSLKIPQEKEEDLFDCFSKSSMLVADRSLVYVSEGFKGFLWRIIYISGGSHAIPAFYEKKLFNGSGGFYVFDSGYGEFIIKASYLGEWIQHHIQSHYSETRWFYLLPVQVLSE